MVLFPHYSKIPYFYPLYMSLSESLNTLTYCTNYLIIMKKLFNVKTFLTLAFIMPLAISAQDKTLTINDFFTNPDIYPHYISNYKWIGNSNNFCYVSNASLVKRSPKVFTGDTIVRLSEINKEIEKLELNKISRFPSVKWINEDVFYFTSENKYLAWDRGDKKLTILGEYPENAENVFIGPSHKTVAYTIDNNLYVNIDGKETAVTNDQDPGIVNGSDYVHRQEFGIDKGIFWSPKGNYLAYYRKDETMVTDYPLVDLSERIAKLDNIKYPMAGMKSEEVTLGVYSLKDDKTIFINTGEHSEQYLTAISWGPEEKYIYIGLLNRDQNHLKLNKYNVATGERVKTLFEEQNEHYVEPEKPLYFRPGYNDQFIWFSERDGFDHMYLYNTEGKLIKQLTKGNWMVTEFTGFDKDGETVFFKATKESPLEQHIYSYNFKKGNLTRLTPEEGVHNGQPSADGKYLLDTYSSKNVSGEYVVNNAKGKRIQTFLKDKRPLTDYKTGEIKLITLRAGDGTDLYCRMIIPPDFDPKKKHPVFMYVYGGPHVQLVNNSWLGGANFFQLYMAQEGFIVFTMDSRGSAYRGFEFESSVHRNMGTIELEDQMKGVEYLHSLDYIDKDRIGLDGWSYGGFMSLSLMLKHPGTFKIAVAGGPVIDWKYYEVMYGERYMDTPQDNPEGYENANLLNYVENLEGKVLVIHGTNDPVVVWQHSLQFIKKCIDEGKLVDYFVYPGHEHNVGGYDRMHLYRKIEQYFKENL